MSRRNTIPFRETRAGKLRRRRPLAHILLCGFLVAVVAAHTAYYYWAVRFVTQLDLHARGDISGAVFYASPKRVFAGQALTRDGLVGYLKDIGFVESEETDRRGTYHLIGRDGLLVNSRLSELRSFEVTFRSGRVLRIRGAAGEEITEALVEPKTLATFVRTFEGEEVAKRFLARRRVVAADEVIGTDLFFAILAAEDDTFMSHRGVRFFHLMLAPFQGRGGSTITMQVIKNAVSLDASNSYLRKLNEIYLATALEGRMSKEEIFQLHNNHSYMGFISGGVALYGYAAAADEYFGKRDLKTLTLSEACVLAGMTHRPNRYLRQVLGGDYSKLIERRDWVLTRLHKEWPDRFTPDVVEAARGEPVRFVFTSRQAPESQLDKISSEFVELARQHRSSVLLDSLPATEYSGGHVFTSIDADLMLYAQRILAERLPQIERRAPPVDEDTGRAVHDRLLGALVALNPRTGEIIAMVGGAGGRDGGQYSSIALNALSAPASTFKPPEVAQALDIARMPDGQPFTASSVVIPGEGRVGGWSPRIGVGRACRVRRCLSRSDDGFAAFTLDRIGLQRGAEFYRSLTGAYPTPLTGKLAIGFGDKLELSPLRQALAYSIFANDGAVVDPRAISSVYQNGVPLALPSPQSGRPVVSPPAAFITAQMLRSVTGWGLDGDVGTAAHTPFANGYLRRHPDIEIGGKTGSGPHGTWMVSVAPNLVVVAWIGYQFHSEFARSNEVMAADTAALIWSDFMTEVARRRPDVLRGQFRQPRGVLQATIDPERGCIYERGVIEFFKENTLPSPCRER
jgi:membrane peptidoglycan carboxypeptidase